MSSVQWLPVQRQSGQPLASTHSPSVQLAPSPQEPLGLVGEHTPSQLPPTHVSPSGQVPFGSSGEHAPTPHTLPHIGSQLELSVKTQEPSSSHSPAQLKLSQSGQQMLSSLPLSPQQRAPALHSAVEPASAHTLAARYMQMP